MDFIFNRPNTLGRLHTISYLDLNEPEDEMIIYEENNPNF
jgi:hypothetical protein